MAWIADPDNFAVCEPTTGRGMQLNETLLKYQQRDYRPTRVVICHLYCELLTIRDQINAIDIHKCDFQTLEHVRNLQHKIRDYEFNLQSAWGFNRDPNPHTWWCRLTQCTCIQPYKYDAYKFSPSCPMPAHSNKSHRFKDIKL